MWVKLDQKLFTFDNDLYFCHMYIPPLNSKVIQDENFDIFLIARAMHNQIQRFRQSVYIWGLKQSYFEFA